MRKYGFALAVSIAGIGCGGGPRPLVTGGVSPEQIVALPAAEAFAGPGLERYAGRAISKASALERRARAAIGRAVRPPAALDCYAREHAARFAIEGGDPDPAAVDALARHCGYWTRPSAVYSITAPSVEALELHLQSLPTEAGEGQLGVGGVSHPDGRVTLTLARGPGEISLEPLEQLPGGAWRLAGRLLRADGEVELWVDDAEGPRMVPIKQTATGHFEGVVPAAEATEASGGTATDPARPSVRIELSRRIGRFRRLIALLETPKRVESAPRASLPVVERAGADSARLTAHLNTVRQRSGRLPLALEGGLVSRLDQWMGRLLEAGLTEPPGLLDDRGWPFARVEFAFTAGRTPEQAIDLLAQTPTGKRLLLSGELDHVAFGARPFDPKALGLGADYVVVAMRRLAQPSAEAGREVVLSAIAKARVQAAVGPLRVDPGLTALAQTLADQALTGALIWDQLVPEVMAGIRRGGLASGAVGAGGMTVVELQRMDFGSEPSAVSAAARFVGVGVVSGPLPEGGAPRHIVIFIVASTVPPAG